MIVRATRHSQLEQGPVGICVAEFLFTLLLQVVLECAGCFWVVALEAVDDVLDELRSLLGVLAVHVGLFMVLFGGFREWTDPGTVQQWRGGRRREISTLVMVGPKDFCV